jgi:two-component system, response regulator PdtaR
VIILVAEDEALIALVLELTLRVVGHRVLGPVGTVADALRLAERTRPELGLIDLNLRDGDDGVMLARALRDRYGTPSLFLSGQVPQARRNRDAAWGLIKKPYDPRNVLRAVEVVEELMSGRPPTSLPPELELFQEG